jgi:hypothetical protein
MKANTHAKAIPEDVLSQAHTKLQEAQALLAPYLLALTADERHTIPKMGEKTVSFVEKAFTLAKENPNLLPSFLALDDFAIDFADARGLLAVHNLLRQLQEGVADTQMTAGSEAYQAALVFYKAVKVAAEQNIPGARAVNEELKARFPSSKRKPS